jgi:hypothetical protein
MSPEQEHRLEEIFGAARDVPPWERTAFLELACGTMPNCAGKRVRYLPRANKASSLPNIGQKCGNV